MNSNKAIVLLCYEDLREIEWIIPTLLKHHRSAHICVPYREKTQRNKIINQFLIKHNFKLTTYLDVLATSKFEKTLTELLPQRMHALVYRLIQMPPSNIIIKLLQKIILNQFIKVFTFQSYDDVYFSNVFEKKDGFFKKRIILFFDKININFTFFPINLSQTPITEFRVSGRIYPCNSPLETYDRITLEGMNNWYKFFEKSTLWKNIKHKANGRPIAGFFTKNPSTFNYSFPIEAIQQYNLEILNGLIDRGFFVVLKPHPGEKLKQNLMNKDFVTTEIPSTILNTLIDCAVFALPTNSIFDAIANGMRPHMPLKILSDKLDVSYEHVFDKFSEHFQHIVNDDCHLAFPDKISSKLISIEERRLIMSKYMEN